MKKLDRSKKIFSTDTFEYDDLKKINQHDFLIFSLTLLTITMGTFVFREIIANPDVNITMFYILGIVIVARYTDGYIWGFMFAAISVVSVNYFFTYPYHELNLMLKGYPITFAAMFVIYIITSLMTTNMKEQARILSRQEKRLMEIEKEKMRANLLRAVSHDLRTPLTGIIGNSGFYLEMEDELSEREKHEIVKSIKEDADWLLNMVENLLSVTRINNETSKVNKSSESVDEVVSSAVTRFKKSFPNAQFKVFLPEDVVMVMMDPILIEQVVTNILQNAQVHAHSTKPLELRVTEDDDKVWFCVKDYGIGINEESLQSIFDGVNYKEKNSGITDGHKGMGIGLSICKTIITAHGGKIGARNHGNGSEVFFCLPKETEE